MTQPITVSILWNPLLNKEPLSLEAASVSTKNKKGSFDVLAEHANFITPIQEDLVVNNGNDQTKISFKEGVLQVSENKVKIFIRS